jgi:hypothetical protein
VTINVTTSQVIVRLLSVGDADSFDHIADDVFDNATREDLIAEFLSDPRHHRLPGEWNAV